MLSFVTRPMGQHARGQRDPDLREVVHADFSDLSSLASASAGHGACIGCLGVTAMGTAIPGRAIPKLGGVDDRA